MKNITPYKTLTTLLILPFVFATPVLGETNTKKDALITDDTTGEPNMSEALEITDIVIGTGDTPKKGQMVSVHYTGTLEDGTKFDSSLDRGVPIEFKFGVGQVIQGWDDGLATLKVGGKRKLRIPPHLGYGARGAGSTIPPHATLLFTVELVAIKG